MSKPLDDLYLEWLYDQVRNEHGPQQKTYWDLMRLLLLKEFVWTVPNDDNRVEDGLDLRVEFVVEIGQRKARYADPRKHMIASASVLEVIIGISRRMAFLAGGSPQGWAWTLIENLGLHRMHDPLTPRWAEQVDEALDRLIWRMYDFDGTGGFFPLAFPDRDQKEVEIWYQMNEYINELPDL
jgi:hypothetical protein